MATINLQTQDQMLLQPVTAPGIPPLRHGDYLSREEFEHRYNEEYVTLDPDEDGILRSRLFPGLWLDAAALINGEMAKVLAALEEGLASSEHAAFVERLQRAKP